MKKHQSAEAILEALNELRDEEKVLFKEKKYGIKTTGSLGIMQKDLKALAKTIEKNDDLALELFDSGIYEARMLVPMLFNPKHITPALIDKWIAYFDTWEICDTFCMSFIGQSPYVYNKVFEYTQKQTEFEKRAGYVMMVGYHFGNKSAPNEDFLGFIPLLKEGSYDERNFVKKAINWALRTIGKRNVDLNRIAIQTAFEILKQESKSAQWIAKDAIKELESSTVKIQDYPRSIYRV